MDEGAYGDSTLLLSGYGRLPEGVASQSLYRTVGVVVVVDRRTSVIADVETTLLTGVARRFARELLLHRSLRTDMDDVKDAIKHRYHGHSQGALLSAVRQLIGQWEKVLLDEQATGSDATTRTTA